MSFTTLHFFLFLAMGVLIYYLASKEAAVGMALVLSYYITLHSVLRHRSF